LPVETRHSAGAIRFGAVALGYDHRRRGAARRGGGSGGGGAGR